MFNTINNILFDKKESNREMLEVFNPYITTKMFSFYDGGDYCDYINNTLNLYSSVFQTKEEQYNFFNNVVPKLKKKNITYLKKKKEDNVEELPIPEFYSRRELDMVENMSKYLNE